MEARETEKVKWRVSNRDGSLGDPVEFEMLSADLSTLRGEWKTAAALPEGPERSLRIRELRFQMDVFATFPIAEIVRGAVSPSAQPVASPDPTPSEPAGEPEAAAEGQPELFSAPVARARNGDPWTSHAAAHSIPSEAIRRSQEAILQTMRAYGFPIDDVKLAEIYDRPPPQSPSGLRTRRSELVDAGLVRDSGQTTILPSGRRAILWELA